MRSTVLKQERNPNVSRSLSRSKAAGLRVSNGAYVTLGPAKSNASRSEAALD